MLLDLLQGAPMMHAGTSSSLPSLPDDLSFTDILSACLPDATSSISLLHILQDGARIPANAFLHTYPTSTECQISLPRSSLHTLHNTLPQHHDEIKQQHMTLMHPADTASLQRRAPPCMHYSSKILAAQLQSPCKRSNEAPEPATSSATSEPSSTLENMEASEFAARNQQVHHLNSSSQWQISRVVGFKSEDGAQQSTQTSLDEESSIQISIQESKPSAHQLSIGEDTCTTADPHAHVQIEESCSLDNNPACDVHNSTATRDAIASRSMKKRKRTRICKNSEEVESQRMTHIAVERNRRKQMNEHLSVLRSLMPATYIQRGDQASIVGGAIDFVKELEHVLQALQIKKHHGDSEVNRSIPNHDSALMLERLMVKSHYTQRSTRCNYMETPNDIFAHLTCQGVDVEVKLIGSRALVKVLAQKLPHQLLNVTSSLESLQLRIMHLNITTIEQSVLYAFNLEIQGDSQALIANDIAQSIQSIFKL